MGPDLLCLPVKVRVSAGPRADFSPEEMALDGKRELLSDTTWMSRLIL